MIRSIPAKRAIFNAPDRPSSTPASRTGCSTIVPSRFRCHSTRTSTASDGDHHSLRVSSPWSAPVTRLLRLDHPRADLPAADRHASRGRPPPTRGGRRSRRPCRPTASFSPRRNFAGRSSTRRHGVAGHLARVAEVPTRIVRAMPLTPAVAGLDPPALGVVARDAQVDEPRVRRRGDDEQRVGRELAADRQRPEPDPLVAARRRTRRRPRPGSRPPRPCVATAPSAAERLAAAPMRCSRPRPTTRRRRSRPGSRAR